MFCQRAFALWGNWGSQRTLHAFANRTCRPANQNLQKSAIYPLQINLNITKMTESTNSPKVELTYTPVAVIDGISDGVKEEIASVIDLIANNEGINANNIVAKTDNKSKPSIERYLKLARDLEIIEFKGASKTVII